MRHILRFKGFRWALWLGVFGTFMIGAATARAELAVFGGTIFPVTGEPIPNGVILVRDGKIEAVGRVGAVRVPEGYRQLRAAVVTPGLIDGRTTVGLSGLLNQPHDQDQLDRSGAMQPELRALDAYNGRDPLVAWVRQFGVTTVHTGPAPGALIPGQTLVVKTWPENVDEAVLVPEAMVTVTLGDGAMREGDRSPGNRSKAVAMLRAEFERAREYVSRRNSGGEQRPGMQLSLDTLGRVLSRQQKILVTAQRHQDIASALRLAEEFNLDLALDGVADSHALIPAIQRSNVPVIVHPLMGRLFSEMENLSLTTPMRLREAGIAFVFQSGFEEYVPKTRVVLFEAAMAVRHGLGFHDALAALTIRPAALLGIDKRVGSIEPGKDADLALYDGDPFEYLTRCVGVVISGRPLPGEFSPENSGRN